MSSGRDALRQAPPIALPSFSIHSAVVCCGVIGTHPRLGRDDGPFSSRAQDAGARVLRAGPVLLCMGLFSRFCAGALRAAEEALRPGSAKASVEAAVKKAKRE
jgi:hypothetical protein